MTVPKKVKKKTKSDIIGTPVTSEDLLEQGIEVYGDEVGDKEKREAKTPEPPVEGEVIDDSKLDKKSEDK